MFNNPFSAIAIGAVLGFMSLAPMQKLTNSWSVSLCQARGSSHQLVAHSNFFGDLKSCIDKRYL
tara:strand:- start:127 stop:318 length:192 start_codon:yes stop_codon:yes gene_type:complete